jgi:hypothetical protein
MGADKISSPKRELSLCPKYTTKDSHTSLPRSRSHTEPTNPRNKPQTIPKQKHDSRSKGLSCPAKALADGPRGRGKRSARTGRTVRDPRADGSLNAIEPIAAHPARCEQTREQQAESKSMSSLPHILPWISQTA